MDGDMGSVEIWIDRNKQQNYDKDVFDSATKFTWKHGPVNVHVHGRHVGIYGKFSDTYLAYVELMKPITICMMVKL